MKTKGIWQSSPEPHDYPAAAAYLSLMFEQRDVVRLVKALRMAKTVEYAAKDLLRASKTNMLEKKNLHVSEDLRRIRKGKKLSPVLLVRGDGRKGVTLTIADGYHRICASWYRDERCPVACRIVDLPK